MLLRWIVAVILCLQCWRTCEAGNEFSCEGRASGYYADIESGCQVYHMCDGLGRQFSYTCPNTTLFQQRMLICDHWYMVNCSKSELDYSANLLIGQRDKPFVDDSSENPYHRTPRPDLENHPYAPNFRQDYRQGKAQFGTNKNLVGAYNDNENSTNVPPYFLPSHWSTQYSKGSTTPIPFKKFSKISDKSSVPIKNTKIVTSFKNLDKNVPPPSRITLPPLPPKNTFSTTESIGKSETKFTRTANGQTTVFQGFGPTTKEPELEDPAAPPLSKILLPPRYSPISESQEQLSTSKVPERITQAPKTFKAAFSTQTTTVPSFKPPLSNAELINALKLSTLDAPKTTTPYPTKITTRAEATPPDYLEPPRGFSLGAAAIATNEVEPPSIFYQPPKLTFSIDSESTTMDPIAFYNLVPSKELEPPVIDDRVDQQKFEADSTTTSRTVTKKDTTNSIAPTTENFDDIKKWKELRQMFFIPEYDFPLEVGSGPSYESGISSFHVQGSTNTDSKSTQQVKCDPKCDPSFLAPGSCKPCVTIRR